MRRQPRLDIDGIARVQTSVPAQKNVHVVFERIRHAARNRKRMTPSETVALGEMKKISSC